MKRIMHNGHLKAILILLLFFAGACAPKVEEEKVIIAQIGNDKIFLGQFEDEYASERRRYGSNYPLDKDAALKLKAAYLKQMIDERLILLEGKRLGVTVGAEEVDAAISEIRKNYSDAKSFEKMLIKEYINFDQWKEKIEKKLIIDKVIAQFVLSKVKILPEEINSYYVNQNEKFHRDEQVKVRQILLREEADAVKVRERIREGEDFAAVAREVSQSPDSQEGGDLGFFSRGIMPPEFDEVVFTIKVGMLSEVVESPYGYHIFLVEDKRAALDLSLQEAQGQITEVLKRAKTEELYMNWMEEVKKRTEVKINEDVLRKSMGIK